MNLTPEQVAEYNRLVEEEGKEPVLEWVKDQYQGYHQPDPLEEAVYIDNRDSEYPELWTLGGSGGDIGDGFTTWKAAALAAERIIMDTAAPLFGEK